MKVRIDDIEYTVKLAESEKARKQGLSGLKTIPNNAGLLFLFPTEVVVPMQTKEMLFDIDIIYINNDKIVAVKKNVKPGNDIIVPVKVTSILEIKASDQPISINSEITIIGDKNTDGTVKPVGDLPEQGTNAVLDENGVPQMITKGNERVFSRLHTKQLVELSKKAANDDTYLKLGKAVVKMINTQDTQKKEYAKS